MRRRRRVRCGIRCSCTRAETPGVLSLRAQGRCRVDPYCPPGGHRTGEQCRRDEQHRRADEQNLIPDVSTQDLREIGIQGGKRTSERERPRGAEDRARDDQERAFPEDEPQDMGALGAERQPDPDFAAPASDRIGCDAGQADGGEHETEQTQTGELADNEPDHALESLEVLVHRTSVEDGEPRVSPPKFVVDGGHRAAIGHAADQHRRPLDRGAAEARDR